MNELMTIQSVRGYMKDDTAYLNLEDVARGLGFTDGNSVRWARVHTYLEEIGYFARSGDKVKPNSATDTYIPENIFYRLAMKAKNETAEKFQALVADEILPSIRKTGSYSAKPVSPLEALRYTVEVLEQQEKRLNQIESTQQAIKDAVIAEPDNWREDINRKMNKITERIGANQYREIRSESYKLLEQRAGVLLERRLDNKKARMLKEGASKTAIDNTRKIDVIDEDKKLREIYGKIVAEYLIKYLA